MHSSSDPTRRSYEQLLELVRQLIAENERRRAENAQFRAEIAQLKRKNGRSAAPFSKNKRKQDPKRPGRNPTPGACRHRPAPAAEDYSGPPVEVPVSETVCPACGGALVEAGEELVTNTEIPPPPQPAVKAYRIKLRTCGQCQRKVRGPQPEVAPEQCGATAPRVGPRAQAAAQLLHYGDGLPQRQVPRGRKRLTGLPLTQGARVHSALRLGPGAGAGAQADNHLREESPEQAALNPDDPGGRGNGQAAHVRVFESQALTLDHIRAQPRNEAVRAVMGDPYQGPRCPERGQSDEAKELAETTQHKCLAHMLRSSAEGLESNRGPARHCGAVLNSQRQEARELDQACPEPEKKLGDYARGVRALERAVSYPLRPRAGQAADHQRLLQDMGRPHARGNRLRFRHDPTTVAPTHNAAERALRPAVLARQVSPCAKTDRGAPAYAACKRVLGTLKKSGSEVREKLTRLLGPSPPSGTALASAS
jgi:transposase